MVTPPSWRPRANSSKSLGLSAVTMPTALTQPRQFGWHVTQLNRIGSLRCSRLAPARAEPFGIATMPGNAMQTATAPRSAQPRNLSHLLNFNLVPSPHAKTVGNGPTQHQTILSRQRHEKGNRGKPHRPYNFAAPPPQA